MAKHHSDRAKKEPKPAPTFSQFFFSKKGINAPGAWVPFWIVWFIVGGACLFIPSAWIWLISFGSIISVITLVFDARHMWKIKYKI